MTVLPLIESELKLALRRRRMRALRMGCGLAALAIAVWTLFIGSPTRPLGGIGRSLFQTLALFGLLGSLITGVLLGADSVSQERREGTLPLLFLTDLNGPDIVIGKLIAKAIQPWYGLLALIPPMAISVLIGGTTAIELLRMFLAWSTALFVAIAISLVISTFCHRQRTAQITSTFALFFITTAIPSVGWRLSNSTADPIWSQALSVFTPVGAYRFAFAHEYRVAPMVFWLSLVFNWGLGGLAMLFACFRVERARVEDPVTNPVTPHRSTDIKAPGKHSASLSQSLLQERPIEWLERKKSGSLAAFWVGPLLAAGCLEFLHFQSSSQAGRQWNLVFWVICQTLIKLWLTAHAAFAFAADRRSGALESLLGTELNVREILSGMFWGNGRRFFGPVLIVVLAGLISAFQSYGMGMKEDSAILLISSIGLFWDSYALFWIALFQGLVAVTPARGFLMSILRVLLLPAVWFLVMLQIFPGNSLLELVILWGIIGIVNHTPFLLNARSGLRQYFRTLALRPFGAKNPHMESEWSPINWDLEPGQERLPSP